jgi:hypothetical protein
VAGSQPGAERRPDAAKAASRVPIFVDRMAGKSKVPSAGNPEICSFRALVSVSKVLESDMDAGSATGNADARDKYDDRQSHHGALPAAQLVGEPTTINLVIGLIAVFAGIWVATSGMASTQF